MKRKIVSWGFCALLLLAACTKDLLLDPYSNNRSPNGINTQYRTEPNRYMMLCETANNQILIVNATTGSDYWSWNASDDSNILSADKPYFTDPTDAKRVLDGAYILASFNSGPSGAPDSERGGVALIKYPEGNTVFYSRCGYQPHSAEILPDGNVIVVSSATGGGITLFKMDRANLPSTSFSRSIPLTFVHGAAWDKKRQRLYVAGQNVIYSYKYDFNINSPNLIAVSSENITLPWEDRNAHDLFPVYDQDALWLSAQHVYKIDMPTRTWSESDTLVRVKSVSSGPTGYKNVVLQSSSSTSYTNNKVIELVTKSTVFQRTGLAIYKARWHFQAGTPFSYRNSSAKILDFNNDGKTDFALFNVSGSPTKWKVYGDDEYRQTYGSGSQIPVPADYDGDGRTDEAVWDPADFNWHITTAADVAWGTTNDIPVPADYDGNGIDDVAVWRPSNGNWYIKNQTTITYGVSTDIPAPADYTGDGNADAAVLRPASGGNNNKFYIKNNTTIDFGTTDLTIPVPGDFDGDGDSDIAAYSKVTGKWTIKGLNGYSSTINANVIVSFSSSDIPCAGDFLELDKSQAAIYRPSTGTLYVYNNGSVTTMVISSVSGFKLLNLPYSIRKSFFP